MEIALIAQPGPELSKTTPTATLMHVITRLKNWSLMVLAKNAQRDGCQTSIWLIVTKLVSNALAIPLERETSAWSAQCTQDLKTITATAVQTFAIKIVLLYRQVSAKDVKLEPSQISFWEDNA
jgi:uncharacterized circularly permuted ATP-grasp superfamily protein